MISSSKCHIICSKLFYIFIPSFSGGMKGYLGLTLSKILRPNEKLLLQYLGVVNCKITSSSSLVAEQGEVLADVLLLRSSVAWG